MEEQASNLNFLGLIFTVGMGFLLLFLPRKYAMIPILMSACYMTMGQMVVVGSLHFSVIRILILFGWIRIIGKKELLTVKLNTIDKMLILYVIVSFLTYVILWKTPEAVMYRLGAKYNTIGLYFLFRSLIRDLNDITMTIKLIGIFMIPLAFLMAAEKLTGHNVFSGFGGVPEMTVIRDGHLRCQGPFRHPILAGTFAATSTPLLIGLWIRNSRYRSLAVLGLISASVITIVTASGGPIITYLSVLVALTMWFFRYNMRTVRWLIIFALVSLHLIMKAPVWFLIARVGEITGGTAWHRAALIDAAISHISEWWFVGTSYTAHWMPYALAIDPTMADITNQYIAEGVNGGVVTMLIFIFIIVQSYKTIGKTIRLSNEISKKDRIIIWSLGCALFGHVVSFFSVSYFDQMVVFWYVLLAMIAALVPFIRRVREPAITCPSTMSDVTQIALPTA